mmetsp:Transcript_30016/g.96269  ORF Transcript_30016/g.96269 Transcript_30016/m.96269 type:complete len:114 (+) Transcript_30016:610-951(+)
MPTTGEAHWEVLLRARAIETQCYVAAAAQFGRHNEKRSSYGHALIVDPWGKVLQDAGSESAGVVVADLDFSLLEQVRARMPMSAHRRTDVLRVAVVGTGVKVISYQQHLTPSL